MSAGLYPDLVGPRLEADPADVVLIDEGAPLTVGAVTAEAWAAAGWIAGRRFAVVADNSSRYVSLWHAAMWGGGVIAPLNTRLSAAELRSVLVHAAPEAVFVDIAHAEVVAAALGDLRTRPVSVALDDAADADVRFADLAPCASPPPRPEPDAPVLLMYTGGTTGMPKGVVHSHANVCHGAIERTNDFLDTGQPDTCFFQAAPMFHIMGIVGCVTIPASGGRTVLRRQFTVGQLLDDVHAYGVTHIAVVPTMLAMLFDHPGYAPDRLTSLRSIAYGGAAMPAGLLRRVLEELPGAGLTNSYGMTEVCGSLTALTPDDHRAKRALDSVGKVVAGIDLEIRDPDDKPVPAGERGEIVARTPSTLLEYRDDPRRTRRVVQDGWYRTGDVGWLDDDGYLRVVDRIDDMIVTGGENVYAAEVEAVIGSLDGVTQVAVVGVPDDKWGQVIHAVVVTSSVTADEVVAHCRAHLTRYKVPKAVSTRTDPLPLSGANKVQRHRIREELMSP